MSDNEALSKKESRIPLHVVEDHSDALYYILRAIGSKQLDFKNNFLLHFDSHPDLLINTELKSSEVFDKRILLEKIDIATWILPLSFAGHVTTIVWVKPEWSNQIEEGHYTFHIGVTEDGSIKVSSPLLYFVSSLNYSPLEELKDPKLINLHVVSLDHSSVQLEKCKHMILTLLKDHDKYWLDIDLDFFSTCNPFVDMYKDAHMYEKLKTIYEFKKDEITQHSALEAQLKRKAHFEILDQMFKNLENIKSPKVILNSIDDICSTAKHTTFYQLLKELITDLCKIYGQNIDWEMVHEAGTTIDDEQHELPHHPCTEDEILLYMNQIQHILNDLPPPKIISVARSSVDNYCPPEIVEFIQENLCLILKQIFNPEITLQYL